jgi:hypothetical protein
MRRVLGFAILLATTGCTLPWEVHDPPEAFLDPERPPALSIFPPLVDSEIAVQIPAFAYCWGPLDGVGGETCVDAQPPFDSVQVSLPAPGDVALSWMNLTGWSFAASGVEANDSITPATELAVRLENDLLVSMPAGGVWDVTLRGLGPQGDAAWAFRVTIGEAGQPRDAGAIP